MSVKTWPSLIKIQNITICQQNRAYLTWKYHKLPRIDLKTGKLFMGQDQKGPKLKINNHQLFISLSNSFYSFVRVLFDRRM